MKTLTSYTIQIPEPCHENWDNMLPDAKGKFCTSCSKSVVDFSNKTDLEIRTILAEHKDQKVCGHFKSSQINRPLNIRIDLDNLPKNMSSTKRFTLALFLVFGTFLFSCTDVNGQVVKNIEVEETGKVVYMKGKIRSRIVETQPEPVEVKDSIKLIQPEPMINGGIRFVETEAPVPPMPPEPPVAPVPPIMDTLVEVEPMIMGEMMASPFIIGDTLVNENQETLPTIINELITPQPELIIYPNPSTGEFTIRYDVLKRSDVRVDVFDEKGNLLKTAVNVSGQYEGKYHIPVSLNELPNGHYIIGILNDGKRRTQKLILEK